MSSEEPSNAVLEEKIDNLTDVVKRHDARIDGMVQVIAGMQLQQVKDRAELEARINANVQRMKDHDEWTQKQEASGRFRTGATIAVLTAVGALASAAVALALALH